ncbi:hypothetical protein BDR06DRAFT_966692 [Suillus hirtellus]|nr:hypothetical protein BDR06DRAFT_966692 [Suillus hirtellus]
MSTNVNGYAPALLSEKQPRRTKNVKRLAAKVRSRWTFSIDLESQSEVGKAEHSGLLALGKRFYTCTSSPYEVVHVGVQMMKAEANVCESPEANNSKSYVKEAACHALDSKDGCRRSREIWQRRAQPLLNTPNTHGNRQTQIQTETFHESADPRYSGLLLSAIQYYLIDV